MNEDEKGGEPPAGAGHEPDWASLVVPDDIRELDADISAYRRELRHRRRMLRFQRLVLGPRRRPHGMSGRLTVIVLVLVAMLGGLMVFLRPTPGNDPQRLARPLARSTVAVGSVGGLLPAAMVDLRTTPVSLRDAQMRPAVYLLIGRRCNCQTLVDRIAGQGVNEARVSTFVVVSTAPDEGLADTIENDELAKAVFDPSAVLARTFGAGTPTILLVARDGIVRRIVHNVTAETHLSALTSDVE